MEIEKTKTSKMSRVSKTHIEKRLKKKVNPRLRRALILLKKQNSPQMLRLAKELAKPRRKHIVVNLFKINKFANENEIVIVPGKVLSIGNINKKIKIAAFSFSKQAQEKIKAAGCEALDIEDAIQKHKDFKIII